jgi:ectoine hydroxylase-related dioxygenase (phytanoyl-CoA dioxygenase family)
LNDLYLTRPEVRQMALDARLVRVLRDLLDGAPAICNSLHFERGSQQAFHFDTYYMPGPCVGGLIVSSICLEDVDVQAGPVRYYPGSHRIPPYRFSHGGVHAVPDEMELATKYALGEVERRELAEQPFLGRKGDVLLWHEQLYHGGSPIADQAKTRRSLVTHYWKRDLIELAPGWTLRKQNRHGGYIERPHQPVG